MALQKANPQFPSNFDRLSNAQAIEHHSCCKRVAKIKSQVVRTAINEDFYLSYNSPNGQMAKST